MISKSKTVILSLLDTPAFGGAEQYLLSHLYYLSQKDFTIYLATNQPAVKQRVLQENTTKKHINLIDAPYRLDVIGNWKGLVKYFFDGPKALIWLTSMLWKFRHQKSKIAYLPGFTDRLTFSPFLKLAGWNIIWIEIGPLEPTFRPNWGFPKLLYFLTKWSADHHLTTSKWTGQSMVEIGKLKPSHITLVYPGVKLWTDKHIKQLEQKGKSWKKHHQVTNKKIISYVGRLAKENEVELVIKAFAKVKKSSHNTNWQLVIMGDGPEKKEYQQLVGDLNLTNHVTFTGFISESEKFSILAISDTFVFTRAWELDGFGITTIEALSVKTPVITTDFGPQKEIISHLKNGLRSKPHSVNNLAKYITLLIKKPQLRKKLAQNGLTFVRETFNTSHQQRLVHDILSQYR